MARWLLALWLVFSLTAAACGSDNGSDSADESRESASGELAASEGAPGSDPRSEWVVHETEDCVCADGSDYHYWSRTGASDEVMLYLVGGGACFTAETCSFTDGTYTVDPDEFDPSVDGDGIFAPDEPANPFADWSFVVMPYCTGDVHLGDHTQVYGDELTVHHNGFSNASEGVDHLVRNFPDAAEVVVAGSSAGGVAAPLFGGLVSDALPEASISVLSDGAGAYSDNPTINAGMAALWGTYGNVPDWPVNEGLTPEDWGAPALFVQTGLHDPAIRMARYDNAYDETQADFSSLFGFEDRDLVTVIADNEAQIEAAGVDVHSYIAPGTEHTILARPSFYTLEVEGVPFADWVTRYVDGEPVEDVRCVDCQAP